MVELASRADGAGIALSVDLTHVYWVHARFSHTSRAEPNDVVRVPRCGGTLELLASERGAYALAIDDSDVFFARDGTGIVPSCEPGIKCQAPFPAHNADGLLLAKPKNGGEARVVASGVRHVSALAADAETVYLTDYDAGNVRAIAKGTRESVVVAESAARALAVAVDADNVYWLHGGLGSITLSAAPKRRAGAAAPTALVGGLWQARFLVLSPAEAIVFSTVLVQRTVPDLDWRGVLSSGSATYDGRYVEESERAVRVPKAGTRATATELRYLHAKSFDTAATDGEYVFACGGEERGVWRIALADGRATRIHAAENCTGLAVDASYVFWGDRGRVFRGPK